MHIINESLTSNTHCYLDINHSCPRLLFDHQNYYKKEPRTTQALLL